MFTLAKDEKIVKSWDYALTKSAGVKTTANLTVTNKRVVRTAESKRGVSRDEIPLDSIKTVYYGNSKLSTTSAIVCIVFGVIFFFAIFGIPLLIRVILMLQQASFHIIIETKEREGTSLEVGVVHILGKKKRRALKVKINKSACANIVDEFGAALIDASAMN